MSSGTPSKAQRVSTPQSNRLMGTPTSRGQASHTIVILSDEEENDGAGASESGFPKEMWCTNCVQELPHNRAIKCVIGDKGSRCKSCIKDKNSDCIQFNVAKFPGCWNEIQAVLQTLANAGPPPLAPAFDAEARRLEDYCNMLVEFVGIRNDDFGKHRSELATAERKIRILLDRNQHLRDENGNYAVEMQKIRKKHEKEITDREVVIKEKNARIAELGHTLQMGKGPLETAGKVLKDMLKEIKKTGVTEDEVSVFMEIDG